VSDTQNYDGCPSRRKRKQKLACPLARTHTVGRRSDVACSGEYPHGVSLPYRAKRMGSVPLARTLLACRSAASQCSPFPRRFTI